MSFRKSRDSPLSCYGRFIQRSHRWSARYHWHYRSIWLFNDLI